MKKLRALPRVTMFILSAECVEQFAYYGLSALLPLYLLRFGLSQDSSTAIFSAYKAAAYLSPVLGSVLADAWLGKYWTIVAGTLLYALGLTWIAVVGRVEGHLPYFLVGLFTVALATGGIKSVVAALLGDQIDTDVGPTGLMDFAYSILYVSINLGAVLSFTVIPNN